MKINELFNRSYVNESKLNELKFSQAREVKKGQITPAALDKKLESWGYKITGTGSYSEVWEKPDSNIVVKVSTRKPDECWRQFTKLAKKYKNNKHFPKIGKLHWIEHRGKKYFIAFMEKLQPVSILGSKTEMGLRDAFYEIHQAMVVHLDDNVKALLLGGGDPENIDVTEEDIQRVQELLPESLRKAIYTTYEEMPDNCLGDFHTGNLMVRPNTGDLVLIDPWMEY